MTEIRPTCMVCNWTVLEDYCYSPEPEKRAWDACICKDCVKSARDSLPDNIIREVFEEDWSERWIKTPLLWE